MLSTGARATGLNFGIEFYKEIRPYVQTYLTGLYHELEKRQLVVQEAIELRTWPGSQQPSNHSLSTLALEMQKLERAGLIAPRFKPGPRGSLVPDPNAQEISINEFLTKYHQGVLLGPPGSGKTTTLCGLVRDYGNVWFEQNNQLQFIPIFVALNRWENPKTDLVPFVTGLVAQHSPELAQVLPALLAQGRVLLLLDGLNELPGLQRNERTGVIEDPRSKAVAELNRQLFCLISCRIKEFEGGPEWHDLHILPLERSEVERYSETYFNLYYQDADRAAELATKFGADLFDTKDKQTRKLQEHAQLPFYLRHMVSYYAGLEGQLPDNPARLIEYSVKDALLREVEAVPPRLKESEVEQLQIRLGYLAFNMLDAGQINVVSRELAITWLFQVREYAAEQEPQVEATERTQLEQLVKKAEGAGFLVQTATEIQFYHQLMQEYFCAYHCLVQPAMDLELLDRTMYPQFREMWLIWAGLDSELANKLGHLLKLDAQNNLGYYAALALTQMDEPGTSLLIEALSNEDSNVRQYASMAIEQIGAGAIETITKALTNANNIQLYAIAEILGKIGDREVLPLLEKMSENKTIADSKSQLVWEVATNSIERIKEREGFTLELASLESNIGDTSAIPAFINALKHYDINVREKATLALSEYSGTEGAAQAIVSLITALKDQDSNVRGMVAEILGKYVQAKGAAQAIAPLIMALRDQDSNVRWRAAFALGHYAQVEGAAEAIAPLIAILKDRDSHVRLMAAEILGKYVQVKGAAEAIAPLIAMLKDRDSMVRWTATEILGEYAQAEDAAQAITPLIAMLKDQDSNVREMAARILGEYVQAEGAAQAIAPLIVALRDQDSNVRGMVAEILGKYAQVEGVAQAITPLIAILKDRDSHVRWRAAFALGHYAQAEGAAEAIAPLIAILRDQDSNVRGMVAEILGKYVQVKGAAEAIAPLIAMLKDQDSNVREMAARILGKYTQVEGVAQAIAPLIMALRDQDSNVRWRAAEALGELDDADVLPKLEEIVSKDKDTNYSRHEQDIS